MTARDRAQAAIYAALFVVLAGSGALSLFRNGAGARFWEDFTFGYLLLLVVYTWYLFTLLFIHDVHPRSYPVYTDEKIAVLVPCFNESPELVERSIRTVLAARGRKQVIVIDDGSTNGVQDRLALLAGELPISVHYFSDNRGKREALHAAVTRLLDDDVLFWDLTAPFLAFRLRIALIVTAVHNPTLLFRTILPSWIVLMLVRYIFVPLRAPKKLLGLFLYMLFYEGCLYWLNLWALFTVRNSSWGTRRVSAQR